MYVDDDRDDQELLTDAIHTCNAELTVDLADNGLVAMDYLNRSKEQNNLPCLIVLDLNMPYLDGNEVFTRIKNDDSLKNVPVIIFSSSEKLADKQWFAEQGTEFITKPHNLTYLKSVAGHIVEVCS